MPVETIQAKVFCFEHNRKRTMESYSQFEVRVNNFLDNIQVKSIRSYVSENAVLITVCW